MILLTCGTIMCITLCSRIILRMFKGSIFKLHKLLENISWITFKVCNPKYKVPFLKTKVLGCLTVRLSFRITLLLLQVFFLLGYSWSGENLLRSFEVFYYFSSLLFYTALVSNACSIFWPSQDTSGNTTANALSSSKYHLCTCLRTQSSCWRATVSVMIL